MAAPQVHVIPPDSPRLETIERSDDQRRDGAGPCGISWCEVEMLQDAVCGNGLSLMDSRDDDAPSNHEARQMLPVAAGSSFIDDKLRRFADQDLELAAKASVDSRRTARDDVNPAMVSKHEDTKLAANGNAWLNSSSGEKARYEAFMATVEAASQQHGAQSLPVADLYVVKGAECNQPTAGPKSKELALMLFEEAFGIFQTMLGDADERTIDCRIHLGKTYMALGGYGEALDCFCTAAYMREHLLGEFHPSVSEIWALVSSVHHVKGKLELALKASAKALTGYRNSHGDKHLTVLAVLREIAQLHVEMGNVDKAEDIQKYVRLHSPKENKGEF